MSIESIKWNIANNPKLEEYQGRLSDVLQRIALTNHEGTAEFRRELEAERDDLQQKLAAINATRPMV